MHNKKMFDIEDEGQGVQHSQWCHSMVNINLGKSHMMHFCDSSHRFWDIVSNLWPWNFCSRSCNVGNGRIGWKLLTFIKVIPEDFSLALTIFKIFTFQNVWPWKCKLRSRCFTAAPFDGKYMTSYLMAIVMFAFSSLCKK